MSVYQGDYAKLYDLFYADKPYSDEAKFLDRQLKAHAQGPSRRLLDVACGTGQHSARLAALGWDVVGVDQSRDMLDSALDGGQERGVRYVEQDMRQLDLPEKEFDAVICMFDSIGYGITNEGIEATLSGVQRHLRPGGLFLAEFWHAAAMLTRHEAVRVRHWETSDGQVVRVSRTELDVQVQTARVDYDVYQLHADGTYQRTSETHLNRYFLVQEMNLFLERAGLRSIRWFAGFDEDRSIDDSTWHVLVLARAEADGAS